MDKFTRFTCAAFLSVLLVACGKKQQAASEAPPLKVGTFYDFEFLNKSDVPRQTSYRVVAVGPASWVQVESYANPGSVFMINFITGTSNEAQQARKQALEELKKTTKLKWINLNQVVSIIPTDPGVVGVLATQETK